MKTLHLQLWTLAIVLLLAGCDSSDDDDTGNYDSTALLTTTADVLIVPAYEDFTGRTQQFNNAVTTAPTAADVDNLRGLLISAWSSWQAVSPWGTEVGVGPGFTAGLTKGQVNVFPTDTAQIEANIASGSFNLEAANALDAKGFPALDYLLNNATSGEVATQLADTSRLNYLKALTQDIATKASAAFTGWTGGYRDEFIANTGNAAGTSLALMLNSWIMDYEDARRFKVGDPIGVRFLGALNPGLVEVRFGKYSRLLALAAFRAHRKIFAGEDPGSPNNYGLHEVLLDLGTPGPNGGLLGDEILAQFDAAIAAVESIPDPLYNAVTNSTPVVQAAYDELQRLIPLLKADLTSTLGVQVSYQDMDGD